MSDDASVLAVSLSRPYAPDSNPRLSLMSAWPFALPDLGYRSVVAIGEPHPGFVAAMGACGSNVTVVASPDDISRVAGPIDVLFVVGQRSHRIADRLPVRSLVDHLGATSILAGEPSDHTLRSAIGAAFALSRSAVPGEVTILPPTGEARSIGRGIRPNALAREVGEAAPTRDRSFAGVLQNLVGSGRPRTGVVLARPDVQEPHQPPAYLVDLARDHGIEIGSYSWRAVARGEFASQKVVVFLESPDPGKPSFVAKVARHRDQNARLQNERRGLDAVVALDLAAPGIAPAVAFAGTRQELFVLAETAIDGRPFKTRGHDQEELLDRAAEWLIALAAASVVPGPAELAGQALLALLDQFTAVYGPTPPLDRFLRDQIDLIARSREPFPFVIQHGDPGVWNLVRAPDGRVGFLDWESCEMRGMPLWDLLYLVRTQAVQAGVVADLRARIDPLSWLADGARLTLLHRVVATASHRIGLDAALVEPLFHACWMHRALKEATRTSPARLRRGAYFRLLVRGVEARRSPSLEALFHAADAGRLV